MNTFDFSPLYRSSIGFDRLQRTLDSAVKQDTSNGYPPYNIEQKGEHEYRISMAVAGFSEDELSVEVKDNALTITGQKKVDDSKPNFLHHGIAARDFERKFQLADFVKIVGADLENGLLHVDLVREVPEEKRPRRIAIRGGKGRVIENEAA